MGSTEKIALAFSLFLVLIYSSGCTGGGCSNDSQCKSTELCRSGSCAECSVEGAYCDQDKPCCNGLDCVSDSCKGLTLPGPENQTGPNGTVENSTDVNVTQTGGQNETEQQLQNETGQQLQNETESQPLAKPTMLDLPEGRRVTVGGLTLEASKMTESLKGCIAADTVLYLSVTRANGTTNLTLKTGDGADLGTAKLKVISILPSISTFPECKIGNPAARFELVKRPFMEASLSQGGKISLPGNKGIAEIIRMDDLGPINDYFEGNLTSGNGTYQAYWREIELAQGESVYYTYPYVDSLSYLNLKIEGIDQVLSPAPKGELCEVNSARVRIRAKTSGSPEIQTSAGEGENTNVRLHKIMVERISGSVLPSDGTSCSIANKSVLLNMTFPRSNVNFDVHFKAYYSDGSTSEMSADSVRPWVSDNMKIEVFPVGGSAHGGGANAVLVRATGTERANRSLIPGENATLGTLGLHLESFEPRAIELADGSCALSGAKATVLLTEGNEAVKKELSIGEVVSLPDGSYAKFLNSEQELRMDMKSCSVYLRRAVILLTPSSTNTR